LFVLGIFAGMFAFAEVYPLVKGFYLSGAGVAMTLPQTFGVPYGVVVFAVVLMAVGGFYGAGLLEKKFATGATE
jgi:ABC-type transporter Mla maintaining outer membrane lipid asymmetry permease subunit MlaE